MNNDKRIARIAGFLYLVIIIFAGFSEGYVRSGLVVGGDAAATAGNIMASEGLFRIGFVTDLVAFMSDLAVAVLLYVLLRPVNKTLSMVAAAFRLVAHPAIAAVNLLNHYIALHLLSGADYLSVFGTDQLNALVLMFLDVHHVGYLIAGAFFGIHLFILGYLLYKSDLFPGILGIMILLAAMGYVVESFGNFLFPVHKVFYGWLVGILAGIGELALMLWLLLKGVRDQKMASGLAA